MKKNEISQKLLKIIQEHVKELVAKHQGPATEVTLDGCDLRALLKISRRTAYEYRKTGLIVYFKVENKIYYFLSAVLDFIRKAGGQNG